MVVKISEKIESQELLDFKAHDIKSTEKTRNEFFLKNCLLDVKGKHSSKVRFFIDDVKPEKLVGIVALSTFRWDVAKKKIRYLSLLIDQFCINSIFSNGENKTLPYWKRNLGNSYSNGLLV